MCEVTDAAVPPDNGTYAGPVSRARSVLVARRATGRCAGATGTPSDHPATFDPHHDRHRIAQAPKTALHRLDCAVTGCGSFSARD
jgi:hypothetical protein